MFTRLSLPVSLVSLTILFLMTGCGQLFAPQSAVCVPGESVSCACTDGTSSAQVCLEDGSGFESCQCGQSASVDPMEYIIGGERSREFAATGALVYGSKAICTATLIAPDMALTAAHCVSGLASFEMGFRLGANPSSPTIDRAVARVHKHPSYIDFNPAQPWTFQNGHDLAILELDQEITSVRPANVYLGDPSALLNAPARLVGYGASDVTVVAGKPYPVGGGIRRASTVRFDTLTAQALRYTFGGMGACNGDSGGPAFIEIDGDWVQVGVTSWGDETCERYGFYQRLDLHADWIKGIVALSERAVSCERDDVCDGQCQLDEDCIELLCPGGSCPAEGGSCAADGVCDPGCGSVDSDCQNEQPPVDTCQAYGLHGNGRCDPQCPRDPDCTVSMNPAPSCNPVALRVAGNQCQYLSSSGQVCQQVPITGLTYDPSTRNCVAVDAAGSACGYSPASYRFDGYYCYYVDTLGNVCGQSYPYCGPGGCSC
ncbi:MAG: trypsin-like serine protease [Myxococcota bacterium]|nr:trypsin-like serine protease [Myxococcota bacterium]